MEIKLTLSASFETVYLINGKLFESGDITYGENEVVYITVLPLNAVLLPYTVKLVGSAVKSNNDLCKCYSLSNENFFLKLSERHNYVYSPFTADQQGPNDAIEKFFSLVLKKKLGQARELMTEELSKSIDDASLSNFFNDFVDIVPAGERGTYYLIKSDNNSVLYNFETKNGLIENIIEM